MFTSLQNLVYFLNAGTAVLLYICGINQKTIKITFELISINILYNLLHIIKTMEFISERTSLINWQYKHTDRLTHGTNCTKLPFQDSYRKYEVLPVQNKKKGIRHYVY